MFKLFNKKKKDNKGFTLVELVIVVAILAILVGILAPQYTKYVEKSRKAADASNMDELVKVVKVFAADPASELPTGVYTITINSQKPESGDNTVITTTEGKTVPQELENELTNSIPKWADTLTKSKKWGEGGASGSICAQITVKADGGTSVLYGVNGTVSETNAFAIYMNTGAEPTPTV